MASDVRKGAQRDADSDYLLDMTAILVLLLVLAAVGVPFWLVSLAFLVVTCLEFAMIVKAPLPWPVRVLFLAILAFTLLLQSARRATNAGDCDASHQQVILDSVPTVGATLRGLNPFEYSCAGPGSGGPD
jgi:hypothetical protein